MASEEYLEGLEEIVKAQDVVGATHLLDLAFLSGFNEGLSTKTESDNLMLVDKSFEINADKWQNVAIYGTAIVLLAGAAVWLMNLRTHSISEKKPTNLRSSQGKEL